MFNRKKLPLLCLILTTLVTTDALYVQYQSGEGSKDSDKNSVQHHNANAHKYAVTGKGILNRGKTAHFADNGNGKTAGRSLYQGSGAGHQASQFGATVSDQQTTSNNTAFRSSNGDKEHGISASKKTGSKSGSSSKSLKKKNHKKDYILNDSIHYGFDKNFNQEQIEDGVYKLNKHLDDKQLANHHDRHRKYKTRRGQSDTSSRSLGSQRGLKESAQNALNGDNSSRFGDFMSKQNAKSKNGANSSIFGSQYNYKAGGNRYANKKGDRLGRSQSSYNLKTKKQRAGASRFGEQKHGGSDFHGPNSTQGITNRGGSQAHKLSSGHGFKISDAKGIVLNRGLSNRDSKFRSGAISDFKKNRNSGDNRKNASVQSESEGDSIRRNREHQNSGKFKNASKRNFADASRFHKSNDSSHKKNVNIVGGENSNKDYRNKVKNKKVSKVFHTSKKVKGDNYERLDFDRKKLQKDRAKDSSFKSSNASKFSNKFRNTNNKAKHHFNNKDNANQNSKSASQADRFHAAKEGNKRKHIQNKYGSHDTGDYSFAKSGQDFQTLGLKQNKSGSGNHASRQRKASLGNSKFADRRVFGIHDNQDVNPLNDLKVAPSLESRVSMPQDNLHGSNKLSHRFDIVQSEDHQPKTHRYFSKAYQPNGGLSSSFQRYIPQTAYSQSVNNQRYQPRSKQSQRYQPRKVYSQRYHPQSVNSRSNHPQGFNPQMYPSPRSSAPKYQPPQGLYHRQPPPIPGQMGYQLERPSSVYEPKAEYQPQNRPRRVHEPSSFNLPSFGVPSQNGGNSFSSFHHPFRTPISHIDRTAKSKNIRNVPSKRFPKFTDHNETPQFQGGFEQMSVSNVFAESFFSPTLF